MITIDSQITFLKEAREEKMAATVLVGLMCGSLDEAVVRLEELMPKLKEIETGSRKIYGKKKERIPVNHDIAIKISDLAEELYPWLKKVAEISREPEEEIKGLA